MTDAEVADFAHALGHMLLSHAAHGLATSSLQGMGEITLRDALVVAAAATGARQRQAWIIEREIVPDGWNDAPVDLIVYKTGNANAVRLLGGAELKWWRRADAGNVANRRRDLLKDFFRAAALYNQASAFSFVTLLTTPEAWSATTDTNGSDRDAMRLLRRRGSQRWNTSGLATSAAVRGAIRALRTKVPVCNAFHTNLLCSARLTVARESTISSKAWTQVPRAVVKVWLVKKPQNTNFMTDERLGDFSGGVA